ncbi:MAG: hypothetical protein HC871_03590 [Rhizobiales bacterium]|nr:hypothetical protein [Hyphomicrobiales bacterium]
MTETPAMTPRAARVRKEDVPLLSVEDLTVTFPTEDGLVQAVRGVSYTLAAREVLGIEGSEILVQRARDNATRNGIAADFAARNLFELTAEALIADGAAQKWLIDPPREGAFALAKATADLVQSGAVWTPPSRIVYVSCNPATLARDAGLLVHQAGYRCMAAGVVNMFPHTAHVESMAVFERT